MIYNGTYIDRSAKPLESDSCRRLHFLLKKIGIWLVISCSRRDYLSNPIRIVSDACRLVNSPVPPTLFMLSIWPIMATASNPNVVPLSTLIAVVAVFLAIIAVLALLLFRRQHKTSDFLRIFVDSNYS